ncbi:MAG: DNA repair protein RadA [Nitrospiria bacterium]
MPKARTSFVCQSCGGQHPKWLGRCAECGTWNSLVEEATGGLVMDVSANGAATPVRLSDVSIDSGEIRSPTGIGELDRVLGGGLVAGSVTLIGGDPGIGKSTLLLQLADRLARSGQTVLYVSGEESVHQIRLRADRLGARHASVWLLAETSLDRVIEAARTHVPKTLIVDSVQTMRSESLESSAGSVGQVRDVASRLMVFAKQTGIATFLVGHVTKDGAIAGPRVLEHIVDTVLYFEGEKGHPYRILRTVKNRFGSTQEVGVFEMKGEGLAEVANPSESFLAERSHGSSGSAILASAEGTRPILVELQALVSHPAAATPRRTANGIDPGRLALLLAVLEKRVGLGVGGQDVFVNVAGGLCLEEPAADLCVAAAVASSWRDRPIDARTVIFGEIGLAGEIRAVPQSEIRLREAGVLGFTRCIAPRRNAERASQPGFEVIGVDDVHDALEVLGVR